MKSKIRTLPNTGEIVQTKAVAIVKSDCQLEFSTKKGCRVAALLLGACNIAEVIDESDIIELMRSLGWEKIK